MLKLDIEKYRDDWSEALQWEKPFYLERPALFSPAAAAQEGNGACQVMWKLIATWIPWQYTDWIEEAMAFHETAFLGDWTSVTKWRIKGPEAFKFLSYYCVNDLSKLAINQLKHAIQTNEQGKVAGEGILYRISEDEFVYTGGGAYWLDYWFHAGKWNAEAKIVNADFFMFHVQGPKSLAIMEKVTAESLRDIRFLWSRMVKINNIDVRVLRMGVTGELGYEIHGPSEHGNDIWTTIFEVGKEFGLKMIGGRAQGVGHIEHGFPSIVSGYYPAAALTGGKSRAHTMETKGGSYEWADVSELTRSPLELGWTKEVSLDTHDFLGREALLAEVKAGGPARHMVGLILNSEDVIDVYAALFRDGPIPTQMDLPRVSYKRAMDPNKVLKDGKVVGCATDRTYSPYLRKMICLCTIDKDLTEPGTQVTLIWGDKGGPQKEIRATVIKLPFKEDKRRIDLSQV